MQKLTFVFMLVFLMGAILTACGTKNDTTNAPFTSDDTSTEVPQNSISIEMAYEASPTSP